MGQVTGDEHWDLFLSIINDTVLGKIGERDVALEELKTSDDFTTEALINQKLAVRLLGREIEALEWVMALPKEIQEKGDQASKLLGTVTETSD